jgi:hypothetical protein
MMSRLLVGVGIFVSLFGVFAVPAMLKRRYVRRPYAIHRTNPDEGDAPWDLTNYQPTGWVDNRGAVVSREWGWSPRLKRVK